MCIFSGEIDYVGNTRIFARCVGTNRQVLVYQMAFSAKKSLAMILPIPVPTGTIEDAVKFINLEKYPTFFGDLSLGFPANEELTKAGSKPDVALGAAEVTLEIHRVGKFIASFVPTLADFKWLDRQFRLPETTWDKMPVYKSYGFVVFQFLTDEERAEADMIERGFFESPPRVKGAAPPIREVHPMAFSFPTETKALIFFPTVHIHDGKIYATAEYDHALYLQLRDTDQLPPRGWRESTKPAEMLLDISKCEGVLAPKSHCYFVSMQGKRKNQDVLV